MNLRLKLMMAPALTGGMLVLTLAASLWLLNSFKSQSAHAHAAVLDTFTRMAAVQARLNAAHTQLYRTITIAASLDEAALNAFSGQKNQNLAALASDTAKAAQAEDDEASRKSLQDIGAGLARYRKSTDTAIDLSSVDPNTGVAAMQMADTDFQALNTALDAVVGRVQVRATEAAARLEAAARFNAAVLGAVGLLAVLGAGLFAWVTQRRIVANINRGARAAAQVAQGELDVTPHSDDRDEMGALLRALGSMVSQLRESIQTVQQASESIGNASAEIAVGNHDLSARTEQTAANLQQTAASMQALTDTVRQSADSARRANALATSAALVAARGGAVVAQVVETMRDINASSRRIADIIGVIDGIAFQTNILALNAAVEAARAGDQGRGFAVVASEVRALARRSADAAKEIKGLIVASVDKVEGGTRLVADAGQTMTEIVGSVQRVSDIIDEITLAASEQSDGIGQVNTAVGQLDQMTQQNAALVEQSSAAAESLKDQAARLTRVVGAFRLDADTNRRGPSPGPARPDPRRLDRIESSTPWTR